MARGKSKGTLFGKPVGKVIKRPGALHRALGVPQGEKIPASKIRKAAAKGGRIGRQARLAQTLSKMRKGRSKR